MALIFTRPSSGVPPVGFAGGNVVVADSTIIIPSGNTSTVSAIVERTGVNITEWHVVLVNPILNETCSFKILHQCYDGNSNHSQSQLIGYLSMQFTYGIVKTSGHIELRITNNESTDITAYVISIDGGF